MTVTGMLTTGRGSRGFTLVEVLVASAILATALIALAGAFAMGVKQNGVAKEETVMAAFAQDKMEQLKRLSWAQLQALFTDGSGGDPNCVDLGADGSCYAAACPAAPAPPVATDAASPSTDRIYDAVEDPISDPNPGDDVKERLYSRYWKVERVNLGMPVGCVYKVTVVVGSRAGIFTRAPQTGGSPSWLYADWQEVVGLDGNPRHQRRVEMATYKSQ